MRNSFHLSFRMAENAEASSLQPLITIICDLEFGIGLFIPHQIVQSCSLPSLCSWSANPESWLPYRISGCGGVNVRECQKLPILFVSTCVSSWSIDRSDFTWNHRFTSNFIRHAIELRSLFQFFRLATIRKKSNMCLQMKFMRIQILWRGETHQ